MKLSSFLILMYVTVIGDTFTNATATVQLDLIDPTTNDNGGRASDPNWCTYNLGGPCSADRPLVATQDLTETGNWHTN